MRTHLRCALTVLVALATAVTLAAPAAAAAEPSNPAVVRRDTWYLKYALTSGVADTSFEFAKESDLPIMGDWDGDGSETPGVYRDGDFILSNTYDDAQVFVVELGRSGDVPIAGDWDADGADEVGVVRGNTWYLDAQLTGGAAERAFEYGAAGDTAVVGDWDGDGTDTAGVMRGNRWYLENQLQSDGAAEISFDFGIATDDPIVGRWRADVGHDQVGVVRGNVWYLNEGFDRGAAERSFRFGAAHDRKLTWGESDSGGVAPDMPQVTYRFYVDTEGSPNGSLDTFAHRALEALDDGRSWSLDHEIRFVQTGDRGAADFDLFLTDDDRVGEKAPVCSDQWSCTVGDDIYINDDNYNNGTETWDHRALEDYQRYVIAHEVGHWLGLDHHNDHDCDGGPAPVMMQQSISLHGCDANLFPLPFEQRIVAERHLE